MSTTERDRAPWSPASGRPRRRRRTAAALGLCAALTLTCAGTVLAVRSFTHGGYLASGDPATGSYTEEAADGDAAAGALLSGPYTERPAPPRVTTRTAAGGRAESVGDAAPATPPAKTADLPVSRPLEATPAAVSPAVGPLFSPGGDGDADHHCTASVVHSPAGDLLVTAAHCVYDRGFRTNLVFAPGYHDGVLPYGVWVPTRIDVDPRWADGHDDAHDVAFVRVRRPHGSGSGAQRIEELTGAERIRFAPPAGLPTRTVGYPDDRETPVGCQNTTTALPGQLRFDCAGFPNGTSGGPLLTGIDPDTGLGTVTGVIGGLDGGGDDATSYSSWFGPDIAELYRRATAERV